MIESLEIRRRIEAKEESFSPFAARSARSRGRRKAEPPSPTRTAFQRDRDRIIHSKSFRRLKHKTQVFIAPLGDHYVTRLTHTLEVAQIARTISRALNLNEDLTEAIALGHDLGHTPFGHVGEDVLNELSPHGFRHNEQSLRVVDTMENDGQGLNLTEEVRDGILNHSKGVARLGDTGSPPATLEGEVVRIADAIAYINHDIGDAIRAGIITEADLPVAALGVLGATHSRRIDTMVSDVIESSWAASGEAPGEPSIKMSAAVLKAANVLRDFLFERVYHLRSAQGEAEKARETVRALYRYFTEHPDRLPAEYRLSGDDAEQGVRDYIAGMTDHYAFRTAEEICGKE
ncbi:MAG: deoxyguanosinetriphosphate triphosphohydrolase [Chloroflexota bacterium]